MAATQGCHNLGNTDGAVEESEISALMAVALKGVGDKGKRHGEHGCPSTAYEQEGQYEHVLVADKRHKGKAYSADNQAQGVSQLLVLEIRKRHSPQHRPDGLPEEQHANPVARLLVALGNHVGGVPYGFGNGTVGVGPHIHKGSPAEELYESDLPEHRRRILEKRYPACALLFCPRLGLVVFGVFRGGPLFYLRRGEDDAEDEYGSSDIERIDDRVGYYALCGFVGNAESRKEERKYVAYKRTGITEK